MDLTKNFIVDGKGKIQSVILDYQSNQKMEEILLDYGLSKAMEEVENDVEFDLEQRKFKDN